MTFVPSIDEKVSRKPPLHGYAIRSLTPTKREREVLYHLARGLTAVDIGIELKISVETVRTLIKIAMQRLLVKTKTAAVAVAILRGYIKIEASDIENI